MQLIDLLAGSIFTSLLTPVVILSFSAYTLYASITLAQIASRRHTDLMAVAKLGRKMSWKTINSLKSTKSTKSVLSVKSVKSVPAEQAGKSIKTQKSFSFDVAKTDA